MLTERVAGTVALDAGESNYVSGAGLQHAAAGRAFVATTAEVSASLGQSIRATIQNPAGSGKTVLLLQISATSADTGGLVVGDVFLNPTTNLPTTAYTPFNNLAGAGPAAATVFKADAGSSMSGGTTTDLHIGLIGAGRKAFEFDSMPIVIPAGVTLGLNIPLGALSATDGLFAAYFIEVAA